jgi:hypothetical protein
VVWADEGQLVVPEVVSISAEETAPGNGKVGLWLSLQQLLGALRGAHVDRQHDLCIQLALPCYCNAALLGLC